MDGMLRGGMLRGGTLRLSRSRPGAVVCAVLVAALLAVPWLAEPAEARDQVGFQGHSFADFVPTEGPLTGEKPESKLWFHDGSWWAAMLSPAAAGAHTIHKLVAGVWTDTGVVIDDRVVSKEDVLHLDDQLYIVSRKSWKLRRYTYAGGTYTLDSGYPVAVPNGAEALTIARDSEGTLWLAWETGGDLRVAHSTNEGASWSTTTLATGLNGDDIAAVIAFSDTNGPAVGVMWSNQNTDQQLFAVHRDGANPGEWAVEEALSGPGEADDHINLKSYAGRVFGVVKTSAGSGSAPLIRLLLRSPDGVWSNRPVATVDEDNTRPITMLHIDQLTEEVYVFFTIDSGQNADGIAYKKAFIPEVIDGGGFPATSTVFIQGATDADSIDDATSMKANGTTQSGIVVLASSATHYWWNRIGGETPPPTSNTAPTADNGSASTTQDVAVEVTLRAGDAEECELGFTVLTQPANGTLGAPADQACESGAPNRDSVTVTYTPDAGYTGPDSFTFKADDGQVDSNTATIDLTVNAEGGGGGEIALRGASSTGNPDAMTTLTIARPPGVVGGDVLLASVDVRRVPTITEPAGWTLVRSTDNGTGMRKATYVRVAGASEPGSYTWTLSSAEAAAGGIVAYSGVDTTTPVLVHSEAVTTERSKLITAPSVTTTVDGAMLVGLFGINGSTAITPPESMVERWDLVSPAGSRPISSAGADEPQATAGATGDRVAVAVDRSGINIGHLVALRPGSGGGTPPPSNTAPTADNGSASTTQDVAVEVTLRAGDAEECELGFTVLTQPANGTLGAPADQACESGAPNRDSVTVTYTPDAGYTGPDSFTFKADDGQVDSNTATIDLTVNAEGGGGGEIALRGASSAANATASSLEISAPPGVAAGDVLLASVDVRGVPTITEPAGWTLVRSTDNGTGMRKATYVRVAGASEPGSYTWTLSSAEAAAGGIVAYSGVDTTTPVLVHSEAVTTERSKLITAPSVTTTVDGAMLVGLFGINGSTAITPPESMVERWDLASVGGSLEISSAGADEPQTTAGATGDRIAVAVDRAGINIGHLVALRPGSGGGTPPTANTAPTADNGSASTTQDVAVEVTLRAGDAEECELGFTVLTQPANGTLGAPAAQACESGGPNRDSVTVTYTPGAGYTGSDSFTFKADDGQVDSNTATIDLTVNAEGGGGGEIALRGASSAANATASSLEISAPPGVVGGDVLVASVDVRGVPTITEPAGWTLVRSTDNGTGMRKATYVRVAGASEPGSYTWTLSSAEAAAGGIVAYSGVDTTTPVDVHGEAVMTSRSKLITAPSVTTTVDGAMLVGLFGINGLTAITPPESMVERWDLASVGGSLEISSAGADEPQATAGATGDRVALAVDRQGINIGHLVALRPAG